MMIIRAKLSYYMKKQSFTNFFKKKERELLFLVQINKTHLQNIFVELFLLKSIELPSIFHFDSD
jgi:hypothetical protein